MPAATKRRSALAAELRKLIAASGKSYRQLAEASGVGHVTVWDIAERDSGERTLAIIEAVADALGYRIALVKGKG